VNVQFLDCTLRDGAHVNSGSFGKNHIENIVRGLTKASVDIVEIGFLKNVKYSSDVSSFPCIEDAYGVIAGMPVNPNVRYAVMARADTYDINKLTPCNGKIGLIRVAFYYDYLDKAIEFAKKVKAKGYDITLNLINTPGSTLPELDKLIKYANEIGPYAVMIVDTFGVLDIEQLTIIAKNYSEKLDQKIRVGLHTHENMALAFSLVKDFIRTVGSKRDIVVDASLMGMGRAPGNLCTELICDYLNRNKGKNYDISEILDVIEKDIIPIRKTYKWGYSPEYFLSAKYRVHRSYAEYLSDKNVDLRSIDRILSMIDPEHASTFDKEYLSNLMNNENCGN